MSAATTSAAAQAYLAAVGRELADLPEPDRADLLEDLTLHLAALEEEQDERSLEARLGPAVTYAAELRSSAGLPPRQAPLAEAASRVRTWLARARGSAVLRETRSFLPQLLPAWWVLRGYLLVLLPSLATVSTARDFPVPAPAGSHVLGAVLVVVAVVLSVLLGRRRLPRPLLAVVVVVDLVVLAAAANLLASAPERLRVRELRTVAAPSPFTDSPLITTRGPVTDIYPYAADGTPLKDVLLYDQDGRPLLTGRQLWWRDHCRRIVAQPKGPDGLPVLQSYPKRYVLDPAAVTLSGMPVKAGQCQEVARPTVVLPTPSPVALPH